MAFREKAFLNDIDECVRVMVVKVKVEAIPSFDSISARWYWAKTILLSVGGRNEVYRV